MASQNGVAPDTAVTEVEGQKIVANRDCVSLKPSTPEDQALFSVFLQNAIRSAVLRAKLDCNELTSIGIALRSGWISPAAAVEWLSEIGLCDQVLPPESEAA